MLYSSDSLPEIWSAPLPSADLERATDAPWPAVPEQPTPPAPPAAPDASLASAGPPLAVWWMLGGDGD